MNTQGISAFLITQAFAPRGRRTHAPIEALAATGPAGLGKTASNLVAFKIMDAFLDSYQAELPRRYPYKQPPPPPSPTACDLYPPTPFHCYKRCVKEGHYVIEKATLSDSAAQLIQLIG